MKLKPTWQEVRDDEPIYSPEQDDGRKTMMQRIKRIRCWWRYWHRDTPTIGKFRYDVSGICCDCGKVGSGIRMDGE